MTRSDKDSELNLTSDCHRRIIIQNFRLMFDYYIITHLSNILIKIPFTLKYQDIKYDN
jgi:hypothetical protein